MSTAPAQTTNVDINEKQHRIMRYLEREVDAGKEFFKSKFMADELDMSAKEIGSNMLRLAEASNTLAIEKWSYASATTWRVEKA